MAVNPVDISPVLEFLRCRTPSAWVEQAARNIATLLRDHASLELKAARQAQKLIWTYAVGGLASTAGLTQEQCSLLIGRMSRLAREELRHFEKVAGILESRGTPYAAIPASRYAGALHSRVRPREPDRLIDSLLIGALIEARSCERFYCLLRVLPEREPDLTKLYRSLLKSEARHFADYLALAASIAGDEPTDRIADLLDFEAELITSPDPVFRFHSGVPA